MKLTSTEIQELVSFVTLLDEKEELEETLRRFTPDVQLHIVTACSKILFGNIFDEKDFSSKKQS